MRLYLPSIFDEFNHLLSNSSFEREYHSEIYISEDDENIYIDAPLAGVASKDADVTLDPEKRTLTIRGEVKQHREGVKYLLEGRKKYHYEIPFSKEIDFDSPIQAAAKDGILSIQLPKSKKNVPLKIDVA